MKNLTKINCIALLIVGAILTIVSIKLKIDVTAGLGLIACTIAIFVLIGENKKSNNYLKR